LHWHPEELAFYVLQAAQQETVGGAAGLMNIDRVLPQITGANMVGRPGYPPQFQEEAEIAVHRGLGMARKPIDPSTRSR